MEQFTCEIQQYSEAIGKTPQAVLRAALNASGRTWETWVSGKASPTLITADRLRKYMADNPPCVPETSEDAA